MSRNAYFIIGLVLVLVIAGLVFIKTRGGNEVLAPTNKEVTEQSPAPAPEPTSTPTPSSAGSPTPTPPPAGGPSQPSTKTVTYGANGFAPASVTIKAGDTVVFKNNSDRDFWPASGPHPTHTNYPEFDAKRAFSAGGSYSFTFTRTGSWKYHDHLNPALTGTITVQ